MSLLLAAGLWLAALLAAASLAAAIYVLFFAWAGLRVKRAAVSLPAEAHGAPKTRMVVMVPAHNESTGLLPTLESLARARYPGALLHSVVIADNCADDTAAVAALAGVEVWQRDDPSARGKGQALAWAFARATTTVPYDLLVVIDADTTVDAGFFLALDRDFENACQQGRSAIAFQGRYEFAPAPPTQADSPRPAAAPSSSSWFDSLTIASKAAENSFVYRPRSRFGLVTLLQGNGFAVSRAALALAPFCAGSIVEDAEYALSLALAGVPVRFVEDARVLSRMTSRVADAAPQRLRWAGGVLGLFTRAALPLLRRAVAVRDWRLAEAAVMLLLTSRLVLIYLAMGSLLLLPVAWHTAWFAPLASAILLGCALQAIYLWMVLRRSSANPVPLRTLIFLPAYLGFVGFAQGCAALGIRRGLWHRTVR